MRNNPTEPEKRLWRHLSNAQLGGFKFRRQEVIGRAIVDFFCASAKLCVEVDGETHANRARDLRRDAYLNGFRLAVFHVTNAEIMTNMDGVLQGILQTLRLANRPHPNPSPEGEGLENGRASWPRNT